MKILHIAPHFGGGVGTVVLNWVKKDKENEHILLSLGYVEEKSIKICNNNNIEIYDKLIKKYAFICTKIEEVDIVIIHYWNIEILIDFIINTQLPKCRLIFYCHVNGLDAPYIIPDKMIMYSDRFVFSTPISYQATNIKKLNLEQKSKLENILPTGGFDRFKEFKFKKHKDIFNILYIGTLDYAKLHPDFIMMCYEINKNIENVKFILCGTGSSEHLIKEQVKFLEFEDKFLFTGWVDDVQPYLEIADIFLYPLNKNHYGTGEMILMEVLSVGLIPIVLNNFCEASLIENMCSGFIVNNTNEIIDRIKLLKEDSFLKSYMSNECLKQAKKIYSMEKFINKWKYLFNDVMQKEKREKKYYKSVNTGYRGVDSFIESLGDLGDIFLKYIFYKENNRIEELNEISNNIIILFNSNIQWMSENKGSVLQYLKYKPNDLYLLEWCDLLLNKNTEVCVETK